MSYNINILRALSLAVSLLISCFLLANCTSESTDNDTDGDVDVPDNDMKEENNYATIDMKNLSFVRSEKGRLIDEYGRQIILRGMNARINGVFDVSFDDGRKTLEPIPKFDETDIKHMQKLGYNFLRLCMNWSGLEPKEGEFSEDYLKEVDRIVKLATDAGIYVLIDFHQDAYSKEIGEDGAPLWAIVPEPTELLEGPMHDLNSRRQSSQVLEAFRSFFDNVDNLQDRFLPAWKKMIEIYKDHPGVIGFENMNEPVALHISKGNEKLEAFHEKTAKAMREIDKKHIFWLEPESGIRNQFLYYPLREELFPDDNIIYQPHLYPRGDYRSYDEWVSFLTETIDLMITEGKSFGGTVIVGEWGVHPEYEKAPYYIEAVQDMFEERQIGFAWWVWKENSQGSWGLFDYDETSDKWTLREGKSMDLLIRPTALAIGGKLETQKYDDDSKTLTIKYESKGDEEPTLLFLPERHYPGGFSIEMDGKAVEFTFDKDMDRALLKKKPEKRDS